MWRPDSTLMNEFIPFQSHFCKTIEYTSGRLHI